MTAPVDRPCPPCAAQARAASNRRASLRPGAGLGLAALLAAALVAGCGGAAPGKFGDVRLVNATTAGPALDLHAGEARIASAVAAGTASGYADVEAGTRALSLRLAGSGAQVAGTSADIVKNTDYTLLAYSSAGALSGLLLRDDEAAPAAGSAKVRVFNAASAEAGPLNAYLAPAATGCSGLGASNAVATSATSAAASAYATVAAAGGGTSYRLCVTAAGDSTDVRLDHSPLVLAGRQVKTVVLTDTPGGVLVNALVVEPRGAVTAHANPRARLRLVANAAGRGRVSATANGTALAQGAASPAIGNYVAMTAGALAAEVRIDGVPVVAPGLTLPPGTDRTLLVAGSAAAPTLALLEDDNRLPTAASTPSRLRLVHGVNGLADTLSLSVSLLPVASDVAFPTASPRVGVTSIAGASIEVTASRAVAPLYSATAPADLRSGVYTLFMLGDAGAPVGILRPDRVVGPAAAASGATVGGAGAAR